MARLSPDREERRAELWDRIKRWYPSAQDSEAQWLAAQVICQELRTTQDMSEALREVFRSRYELMPVSVHEFVTGKPYLNLAVGPSGICPKILEVLKQQFAGHYSEVVLTGSITWDKLTFVKLATCYSLYWLSCLKDPALTFGMKTGSNITFLSMAAGTRTAEHTFFQGLRDMIGSSWYFNHRFRFESLKSEIRFPKNVRCYPVAATERAVLGVNVFSAFMDQVDGMNGIASCRRRMPGTPKSYDQAELVFNSLRTRIKSRFNLDGRTAGHLYTSSSSPYIDSFTEERINEARKEGHDDAVHSSQYRRAPYVLIVR